MRCTQQTVLFESNGTLCVVIDLFCSQRLVIQDRCVVAKQIIAAFIKEAMRRSKDISAYPRKH